MDKAAADALKRMVVRFRSSEFYRRVRGHLKQLTCPHTHTFSHSLGGCTHWYNKDAPVSRRAEPQGQHKHIVLCGCYICGRTWVEDWGA